MFSFPLFLTKKRKKKEKEKFILIMTKHINFALFRKIYSKKSILMMIHITLPYTRKQKFKY